MKRIAAYLFLSLLIISSPILGYFLGGMVGNSMDERRQSDQENAPWQQIDSPYKFVEIVDADPNSLWAKTSEGKLYYLKFYCNGGSECVKWIETEDVPSGLHNYGPGSAELPLERGKTCPTTQGPYPEPPQIVVECVLESYMTVVYIGRYYVLLDDGTIWYWNTPVGNDSFGSEDVLALFGLVIGLTVSIILGIVFIFIMNRETNRK